MKTALILALLAVGATATPTIVLKDKVGNNAKITFANGILIYTS